MTFGILLLGLLNGLTIGLLAVGLVLVYKANRFLNLAHAQMGALSALVVAKLVLDWGWGWWAAFALAVLVGVLTGLVVERLFVRRLWLQRGAPVRLLLVSLAVSQLLLALTFIPALTQDRRQLPYPQPFGSHLRVGGVTLTGMWVLTAISVPILVGALGVFMRYTRVGRQIRAAASNPEAARLCGISVTRSSAVTWGLAGGLAAISAVLQAPTQLTFQAASLGPYLLMLTLGAAAFGAFVSLPFALGGGLVLGLVSQFVAAKTSNGSDAELAVFITILLMVLARGKAISKVFALPGGATEAPPATRIPKVLRNSSLVRHQRMWLTACGVVVALVAPLLPWLDSEGHRFLLVLILIYAVVGVGLTMVVGWSGQVSLGHFAVVGLGAYAAARWSADGWSLTSTVLITGLLGAAVMIAIGLPALRVGGLALSVTTMGFAVISADWLFHQGWAGSSQPFANVLPMSLGPDLGVPKSQLSIYYAALAVLVLAVFAAGGLRRLGPGRLAIAVRDNERAAAAFGVIPASLKLAILAVSGLLAGIAGVLWGEAWRGASPEQFAPDLSVAVIAIPVIGGLGSIGGGVLAAVVLYSSTFFIGPLVSHLFGSVGQNLGFQLLLAGAGQIAVLLWYPIGMAGAVQARWQAFLDRRAAWMAGSDQADQEVPGTALIGAATTTVNCHGRLSLDNGEGHRAGWYPQDGALPLTTKGVRLRFGGVVVLDGADINVGSGEIVGLIGPNGAGKTSLINVISGFQPPDAGSIWLFGRQVSDLPPDYRSALGVARTFQEANLFPGLSVIETLQVALAYRQKVGVVGAMLGAPWVRATEHRTHLQAEAIAARFGLSPWTESLTSELSTGTRRICDLAAQVAAGPKLLLLDEPTAGVAQREAEAFGPVMRRIREELDCAVLIVEHDMPLLMSLCDRVYAMAAGRVIAEGSPEDIRHDPAVIASYLGTEETAIARSGAANRPSVEIGRP